MPAPNQRLRALLPGILLIALVASGCVHRYREPLPSEPHALVRVRIVHHTWGGPRLDESVRLNGYAIVMPAPSPRSAGTRAVRVRPEPTTWRIGTEFFHVESRQVLRRYRRREPCGTSRVGFGASRRTQTRYCTRYEHRWETVQRRVVDASCGAGITHQPRVGAAYLLQYDFYAHGQCRAQCLRQLPMPDGTFRLMPCGASEPPGYAGRPQSAPARPPTSGGEVPAPQPHHDASPSEALGTP